MTEKETYLREINKAFATCDIDFLCGCVSEDIRWIVVGERIISGIDEFKDSLYRMKKVGAMEINIKDIITKKNKSVVEGLVKLKDEPGKRKKYAFCDVYIFNENEGHKINELRTYVTELKKI